MPAAEPADLHTHILPGLDDGAADLAEAMAMARIAEEDGLLCLVATPHSLQWPPGTCLEVLEAKVMAMERLLAREGIDLAVVAGAEMVLIPALPQQIDAGEAVTLNRSRYLLLEFLNNRLPPRLDEALFQVQVRGLVPILAHPERNPELQRRPGDLRRLVERGALVQITAASLEGRFGPAAEGAARRFLAENLVHVIASDAHSAEDRPPRLGPAHELAAAIVGPDRARALVADNPAAILADVPLKVEPPAPPRRRWFWRR